MRTCHGTRRALGPHAQSVQTEPFCFVLFSCILTFPRLFQPTSPRRVVAPAWCRPSRPRRCPRRGPPPSPSGARRSPRPPANTSTPRRTRGTSPATSRWAISCLPRPPRPRSPRTSRPPLLGSTSTPTTSTISTRTRTRSLSPYRCCSIRRAPPPSPLRGRLPSRCTS